MKSKKFLLGLLVFILAFGMIVTGCDPNEGNGNGNGNGNGGNGTITGDVGNWWIQTIADG